MTLPILLPQSVISVDSLTRIVMQWCFGLA